MGLGWVLGWGLMWVWRAGGLCWLGLVWFEFWWFLWASCLLCL